MTSTPAPVQRRDAGRLGDLRAAVVGRRRLGVRYHVPPGHDWPDEHAVAGVVHEIDMGVSLTVGDTELHVTWSMRDRDEGLAVLAGPAPAAMFGTGAVALDAGRAPGWAARLGRPVTGLSWSWHRPADDSPDLVWALRIGVEAADPVVIALGCLDGGTPRYLPDSLLVIFDARLARSYFIPAGEESAWG